MRVLPGSPTPLGATLDDTGVNFAIVSEHATAVHLCLFDAAGDLREAVALPLPGRSGNVWHGFVPGLRPGQLYGYRVFGPWDPSRGHRGNAAKVLFDPYGKLVGRVPRIGDPSLFGHACGTDSTGPPDPRDSAAAAPLAAVLDPGFDWADDAPPRVPWSETVIYEMHVRGFSAAHPDIPPELRGTFAALTTPAALEHFRRLGVTTLELLPVHAHSDEPALVPRGVTNYWGYNTLAFFAPDPRFTAPDRMLEAANDFKRMVRGLHAAGLEVILDVVYNHTAEGDHLGPTLSWRGIDNLAMYRLRGDSPAHYVDFTGCGNTVDLRIETALQLVLDSLRYWVTDMHVDGFRFDLATVLTRNDHRVDWASPFLRAVREDPVLSSVKLIAEPWDATHDGYQTGGFPSEWSEWNDRFRDGVRRFWRGDAGRLPDLATRLAGSRDLFDWGGRTARASINFVTSHDGFTLADLVAYNRKHNLANGEGNRDGHDDNLSWNGGVEGPTDDPEVVGLRARQQRNFLLTLLVARGVPMISGGDELGRTQHGNNNAYCHDSPLTWTPWGDGADRDLFEFTCRLTALRATHPVLHRMAFLEGRRDNGVDVIWVTSEGREMTPEDWHDPQRRTLGMLLPDATGTSPTLCVFLHAGTADISVTLPDDGVWELLVDTAHPTRPQTVLRSGANFELVDRSAVVFRNMKDSEGGEEQ